MAQALMDGAGVSLPGGERKGRGEEYQMAQALMDGAGVSLPGGEKLGDCVTSSRRSKLFLPLSSKEKST